MPRSEKQQAFKDGLEAAVKSAKSKQALKALINDEVLLYNFGHEGESPKLELSDKGLVLMTTVETQQDELSEELKDSDKKEGYIKAREEMLKTLPEITTNIVTSQRTQIQALNSAIDQLVDAAFTNKAEVGLKIAGVVAVVGLVGAGLALTAAMPVVIGIGALAYGLGVGVAAGGAGAATYGAILRRNKNTVEKSLSGIEKSCAQLEYSIAAGGALSSMFLENASFKACLEETLKDSAELAEEAKKGLKIYVDSLKNALNTFQNRGNNQVPRGDVSTEAVLQDAQSKVDALRGVAQEIAQLPKEMKQLTEVLVEKGLAQERQ